MARRFGALNKTKKAQETLGGEKFRRANKEEIDRLKAEGDGTYEDNLRAIVDELGILQGRQTVPQTEEIFEDGNGNRRSVEGVVKGFARHNIELVPDNRGGLIAINNGIINDAGARPLKRGELHVDISKLPQEHQFSGFVPQRAQDVQAWANDPVRAARFDPENVSPTETRSDVLRSQAIGRAEMSGDVDAVIAANQRYQFSPEEAAFLSDRLRIGDKSLVTQVRDQGVQGPRSKELLDPATGMRVADMPKAAKLAYMTNRGQTDINTWANSGGTSFGDASSNVVVPGFHYQLEHHNPFSGSKDVVPESTYYSDALNNRVGYLERYENSEKGEISPSDYYDQRRLHYLAAKQGIDLTGVIKTEGGAPLVGREAGEAILARDNPHISYTGERLIKDRSEILDPETKAVNDQLLDLVYGSKQNPKRKAGQRINDLSEGGEGDQRSKSIVINADTVNLGDAKINGNGNGTH